MKDNGRLAPERAVEKREFISATDFGCIEKVREEIKRMKEERDELQEKLTLLSADLIRKKRSLREMFVDLSEKHGLVIGERELNASTGEIVTIQRKD